MAKVPQFPRNVPFSRNGMLTQEAQAYIAALEAALRDALARIEALEP